MRTSESILTEPPPPDADARMAYGPEPLQFGDVRLPAERGRQPLAVVIHGGYWQATYNLTHAGHLCVDLAEHGIATWNVEYRRLGDPGGGWPGTFDDVASAVAFARELAREFPVDAGRVVLVGHSAGGQLALHAASRGALPVRGVVSLGGVVDLHETDRRGDDHGTIRRLLGGGPDDVPERWADASPRARLPLGFRYVLACGTEDAHWESNEATARAAFVAGDDVELLRFDGAGHFEPIDPATPEWAAVRETIVALAR